MTSHRLTIRNSEDANILLEAVNAYGEIVSAKYRSKIETAAEKEDINMVKGLLAEQRNKEAVLMHYRGRIIEIIASFDKELGQNQYIS